MAATTFTLPAPAVASHRPSAEFVRAVGEKALKMLGLERGTEAYAQAALRLTQSELERIKNRQDPDAEVDEAAKQRLQDAASHWRSMLSGNQATGTK